MDRDGSDFGYFAPPSVGRDDFYPDDENPGGGLAPLYDLDENTRESAGGGGAPEEDCDPVKSAVGVDGGWADDVDSFSVPPSSDYPIPLGPPEGFDGVACLEPAPPGDAGSFADSGLGMLFSGETEMQDDVKDAGAEPGVCGLRNMGNTCFMGAGLQCVAATPPLVDFFLARNVDEKDCDSRCLTDQFTVLMQKMWSGNFGVVRPYEFKQALGVNHPQFKDYRQHDCQEFLALLLDNLHEQLNTAGGKSGASTAPATPHSDGQQTGDRSPSPSSESSGEACASFQSPERALDEEEVGEEEGSNNAPAKRRALEKNVANQLNNATQVFRGLQDILKDAKTSNVNVNVADSDARFDKFPKYERNLAEFHNFDDDKVATVKRIKETNVNNVVRQEAARECFNNIKRMKLDEADERWERHLSLNQSVVAETFQGQFKSTVVCSSCKHVSVTYEPFMYLSVPLPHAMERQICVTFVWSSRKEPASFVVTLNKQDKVKTLKAELGRRACAAPGSLALAEVLDNHIAKILDDNLPLRYVNDATRSVYAFEMAPWGDGGGGGDAPGGGLLQTQTATCCAICLEHKDADARRHEGCSCVLCDACIGTYRRHAGKGGDATPTVVDCPVCGRSAAFEEALPGAPPLAARPLDVPLVFRLDSGGGGANNAQRSRLVGHPRLLRLPSRVSCGELRRAVGEVAGAAPSLTLLLVDGRGLRCSRCIYTQHCGGCRVGGGDDQLLQLQAGDTLAVRYLEDSEESAGVVEEVAPPTVAAAPATLTLHDCLVAFSQPEQLDEHNPWFCPVCEANRCATKTLTVRRYPEHLIVYLKRFVFHDSVSVKLEERVAFPVRGLTPPTASSSVTYDLYACVCHFGGASAGHYTAYARNPRNNTWHLYNDEQVTCQGPQEDDYASAYILFYVRQ